MAILYKHLEENNICEYKSQGQLLLGGYYDNRLTESHMYER